MPLWVVKTESIEPDVSYGGAMAVIGVDCGGSSVRTAQFDGRDRVSDVRVAPTPQDLSQLPRVVTALVDGLDGAAVGAGVAGHVVDGWVRWMPHAGGGPIDLGGRLEEALGLPVIVDNDANLAGLAEATHGAGTAFGTVCYIGLGTGIGMGLVVDGVIFRGAGLAGEVGHMKLTAEPASDPPCPCGATGCWEAWVSGTAVRARHGVEGADLGPEYEAVVGELGHWLGRGLANLVEVLDPEVFVIGGGLALLGDRLLEPARHTVTALVSGGVTHAGGVRPSTPVVPAAFGTESGMVGAALAAQQAAAGGSA